MPSQNVLFDMRIILKLKAIKDQQMWEKFSALSLPA